ncbi:MULTISPECIES: hypothetical protein [Nostocales]|uniref:Uncharacterized protein n=3 Tax=Nostocales TaxID=1161 RepID=A0A0C1R1S1_9CYAN|nr:hypothetical protein [Tolypothrix bouteillei]KAF3884657.1 hypothetical protein DA73_0400003585 [Tolypothrix bouteillei VB521301]
MKSFILGSLSLLLLSTTTVPIVKAENRAANPNVLSGASSSTQIEPFNLVHLAYQGYLRDQGIPGYGALIMAYQVKQISAEDIVRSAVKSNILPPQAIDDRAYRNAVNLQLENLRIK